MAAARTMKEEVFFSIMMLELGFKEEFSSLPLYIDNTDDISRHRQPHIQPSHEKHIAMRYFFVQELVEEGKITVHFVKTQDQITDLETEHTNKHRHRALITFIEFKA